MVKSAHVRVLLSFLGILSRIDFHKIGLHRISYRVTMFEDESRDSIKAVTVSDSYLLDALLFDLCKAVETIRYNIIAILINSRNSTFNTAQEYCLAIIF